MNYHFGYVRVKKQLALDVQVGFMTGVRLTVEHSKAVFNDAKT